MQLRLQKYLADCGIASRRRSEEYIKKGSIKVNGKIVKELGIKIDQDKDRVEFKGKNVRPEERHIYIMLHKPAGYVSTCRAHKGERTILDLVKLKERIWPIGRLDKDSEGLIVLTNDGELTNKWTHPKYEKEKEYEVWVDKVITREFLNNMKKGVVIGGYKTRPAKVKQINSSKFSIILKEGRKRQIREMCRNLGYGVERLVRVRIGDIKLGKLKTGEWRQVSMSS